MFLQNVMSTYICYMYMYMGTICLHNTFVDIMIHYVDIYVVK